MLWFQDSFRLPYIQVLSFNSQGRRHLWETRKRGKAACLFQRNKISQKSCCHLTHPHGLIKRYINKNAIFFSSVTSLVSSRMDCVSCNIAFKKGDQKLPCRKCAKWEHRRCYPCKNIFLNFICVCYSGVIFSVKCLSKSYIFL
jgi:hypothetical protein